MTTKLSNKTTNGKFIRVSESVWDWLRSKLTYGQSHNDYLLSLMEKDKKNGKGKVERRS